MLIRHVATVAAIAALLGPVSLAQAQSDDEMLRGGAPKGRLQRFWLRWHRPRPHHRVRYDSTSCARHHRHQHGRAAALSRSRRRLGATLRRRCRPGRLPVEGHAQDHRKKRISKLDGATGDDRAAKGCAEAHEGRRPNNPLGTRAMYLGSTLYRIHGWTIRIRSARRNNPAVSG